MIPGCLGDAHLLNLFERTLLYLSVLLKVVLISVINGPVRGSRLVEITLVITIAAYASDFGIIAW